MANSLEVRVPFLDKETVRTHKKELLADNANKFGITPDSTSGSTGTPLHFVLDNSVQANKIAALLRSYHWAGYFFGKKMRHIPVENVVRDIKESGVKNFMFLDDNIIGHPQYAKELFRAIKPLKINWVGQASVSLLVKDDDLMQLAADSGCKALFFGIESVSVEQLKSMHKAIKEIDHLESALKKIKKMGILIHASMVFGFDSDTKEIFDETVRFLIKNKVSTVSFNILTPYPGTKTYEDLKKENRLITTDWKYYDHNTVVFKPTNMTPYELQMGKVNARKKFYRISSVLRRLSGNMYSPLIYFATNYGHMKQVKVEAKRIAGLKPVLFSET
jgi:radical SAM superfamily enzyme YgiQ (UPF0313 family)